MKISNHIFLASLLIALINACKKQNIDPLSQLPPATQTGARTFGCLVNGQAFVAKGTSIYDPVGISEYYNGRTFNIKGGHKNSDGSITGLDIDIDSVNLVVGQTYTIKLNSGKRKGDGFGRYSYFGTNNNIYNTNDVVSGEVTITSLANATAGTFYFNAVNDKGDTVKITNGRFDW